MCIELAVCYSVCRLLYIMCSVIMYGEESCMKQKSLQYKIAIWLTMGLLVVDPVVMTFSYAEHPIEVDRQAPQDSQAQVTRRLCTG